MVSRAQRVAELRQIEYNVTHSIVDTVDDGVKEDYMSEWMDSINNDYIERKPHHELCHIYIGYYMAKKKIDSFVRELKSYFW